MPMTSDQESARAPQAFTDQVADAYEHLHDLVALRTHPLLGQLVPPSPEAPAKRARRLHDLLRNLIDELDPGAEAPSFSPEWRRHRYMVMRYLKGLTHQAVAEQFGIGLRQYYRVRIEILEEIAAILWARRASPSGTLALDAETPPSPESQLEMLRLEAARLAQVDRFAHVQEVVAGVAQLLEPLMRQRSLFLALELPAHLPAVSVQQDLLRQMLVGLLGFLTERAQGATVRIRSAADQAAVHLTITVDPATAVNPVDRETATIQQLSELQAFAAIGDCHVLPLMELEQIIGFDLSLPIARRTVLVVDDNEGVLQLLTRYLGAHGYRVLAASTAVEALAKAEQFRPFAITVDLMMPEHDGWELLQKLTMQPTTCRIPIIVCSVLKQKELALSLGATAYIEKPVTEGALMAALEALERVPARS